MSTEELPHQILLRIVRGEEIDGHVPTLDERLRAAVIAAPYFAPKLASVTHTGPGEDGRITVEIVQFGDKADRPKDGEPAETAVNRLDPTGQ